jgi:hypothetical protein
VFDTPVEVILSELAIESFFPADPRTARVMRTMSVVGRMLRFKVPRLKRRDRPSASRRMASAPSCAAGMEAAGSAQLSPSLFSPRPF